MKLSKRLRYADPLSSASIGLSARAEQELARLTATATTPDAAATPAQPNLTESGSAWLPPRRLAPRRTPRRLILAGVAATAVVGTGLSWVALHGIDGGPGNGEASITRETVIGEGNPAMVIPANWPVQLAAPITANGAWGPDALIELPDVPDSDQHAVLRLWVKQSADQAGQTGPVDLDFELQADGSYLGRSEIIDGDLILRASTQPNECADGVGMTLTGGDDELIVTNCNGPGQVWTLTLVDDSGSADAVEGAVDFSSVGGDAASDAAGYNFGVTQIGGSDTTLFIVQGSGPDRDHLRTAMQVFGLAADGTWTATPPEASPVPPGPAALAERPAVPSAQADDPDKGDPSDRPGVATSGGVSD